jgi:hypothetical protein
MESKGNSRQGDDSGDSELHVNDMIYQSVVLLFGRWLYCCCCWRLMCGFLMRADTHTHTIPSLKMIVYPKTFIPKAHVIN